MRLTFILAPAYSSGSANVMRIAEYGSGGMCSNACGRTALCEL